MGKLPAMLLAAIAIWVAVNLYQEGPEEAFGGLFDLFSQPQYGEADKPTRSGSLADEVLAEAENTATLPDDGTRQPEFLDF